MINTEMTVGTNLQAWSRDTRTGLWTMESEAHNHVTNSGISWIVDVLSGHPNQLSDPQVTYMEVGTGVTAPTDTDIALETPLARASIPAESRSRTATYFQLQAFFVAASVNTSLFEAGLYGGGGSTITLGTGSLVSRGPITFTNSGGFKDLVLVWRITFSRG